MAKFKTASALILSALWLGACAAPGNGATGNGAMSEKAACQAQGGSYGPAGLAGMDYCNLSYSDAGQVCTDSGQCEGRCLANDFDAAGYDATGQCEADTNPFGCNSEIIGGEVQPGLCVD
ncbi:hypothetical protein [Robiginitomaculum antarcticum]|uniref:hypothetical protein n=1 Tax=Robiginitomaculum antarcticum TaxID=437507 RepID=UPI000363182B|nr:hypothetical protein [Robiginitomaculum antarcticum]